MVMPEGGDGAGGGKSFNNVLDALCSQEYCLLDPPLTLGEQLFVSYGAFAHLILCDKLSMYGETFSVAQCWICGCSLPSSPPGIFNDL